MELYCEGRAGNIGHRLHIARVLLSVSRVNGHQVRERKDLFGLAVFGYPKPLHSVVRMHNVTWDILDTIYIAWRWRILLYLIGIRCIHTSLVT